MNVLALLGQRRQQRTGHARDILAAAARDAAAGKAIDVGAAEAALHELGETPEFFKQLAEIAEKRQAAGRDLERLGVATSKARKAAEAIDAETRRFEETRKAYLSRMSALEAEKAGHDATIAAANKAREILLRPENVLGSDRPRYEEALAERDAAAAAAETLRRELKRERDRIKDADRWIADVHLRYERVLKPATIFSRPKYSEQELAEIEPHELTKKRADRAIAEIEPQLREAEERLERAERAVVAIELTILKG